jgi:pyridoxal 5'-phosphate synthase pdxT subunit
MAPMARPVTGVLALQGDFAAHAAVLARLGADVSEVRRVAQLEGLGALVIPGGESSALLKLMAGEEWFDALRRFAAGGGAILGTCAGAILLAREARGPSQPSLGLVDAVVERNAYGRQRESFEGEIEAPSLGGAIRGVFIRAPRIVSTGSGVAVLATREGEPVLIRQGRILAGTFHPELSGEDRLHQELLRLAA